MGDYRYWVQFASRGATVLLFFRTLLTGIASYYTGSSALQVQFMDALLDFFKACVNQRLLAYALKPASSIHPFGYGKVEHLWMLIQGALLGGASLVLIKSSAVSMLYPTPIAHFEKGVAIALVCAFLMSLLCIMQWKVVRWTGSPAIYADFLHNCGDLLSGVAVIGSLTLSLYGWSRVEPLFALFISLHLLRGAVGMLRDAVQTLCDCGLPAVELSVIRSTVASVDKALIVRRVRSRRAGAVRFVELQLQAEAQVTLGELTGRIKAIETALRGCFPMIDVVCQFWGAATEE